MHSENDTGPLTTAKHTQHTQHTHATQTTRTHTRTRTRTPHAYTNTHTQLCRGNSVTDEGKGAAQTAAGDRSRALAFKGGRRLLVGGGVGAGPGGWAIAARLWRSRRRWRRR